MQNYVSISLCSGFQRVQKEVGLVRKYPLLIKCVLVGWGRSHGSMNPVWVWPNQHPECCSFDWLVYFTASLLKWVIIYRLWACYCALGLTFFSCHKTVTHHACAPRASDSSGVSADEKSECHSFDASQALAALSLENEAFWTTLAVGWKSKGRKLELQSHLNPLRVSTYT